MVNYIYDDRGNAVGYREGRYVYSIRGDAIGQMVDATHVHRLTGQYVGELWVDMIVDKHLGDLGNVGNPGDPGNAGNPGDPGNRGDVNCGYTDVSSKLFKNP